MTHSFSVGSDRNPPNEKNSPQFTPIPPRYSGLVACKRCEGLFRSSHGNQKLCGSCRNAPVPWKPGEVSLGTRLCLLCGAEFEARKWQQKFCSVRHRHLARKESNRRKYANQSHRGGRERWRPVVATGSVRCARGPACGRAELVGSVKVGGLIDPREAWHLGHADQESVGGPEHRACNVGAPARLEAQARRVSRAW